MGEARRKRERLVDERAEQARGEVHDKGELLAPVPSANLGILHLSDLHIGTSEDIVLGRAEAIARTTNTLSHHVDRWVILATGDIARNGTAGEYQQAEQFLKAVYRHLHEFHPTSAISFVVIPGNHDCDFSLDSANRRLLLQPIKKNVDSSEESI